MQSLNQVNGNESTDARLTSLVSWLRNDCAFIFSSIQPIAGDASFRRYFRVQTTSGSYIAMDAPPPLENCRPFVAISRALRKHGLLTPEIIAFDIERGYLLLSDFGDATFLKSLHAGNADQLYRSALDSLSTLQSCRDVPDWIIPSFDATWMWNEWAWHQEWFLEKWLGISCGDMKEALDACFAVLVQSAVTQPQVFMHRDFHSANLMLLPEGQVGVLDFQDAFIGPLTYDVASLLRDCYIDWTDEQVHAWSTYYFRRLVDGDVLQQHDLLQYQRWFDLMGIERHLKALLTFARKHVRDHQSQYLRHVPRTLTYLLAVTSRYPELVALHTFLKNVVQPNVNKALLTCEQ